MASKVFIYAIQQMMKNFLVDSAADLRVRLCMSNTTCATSALTTADTISDITTVDKSDDSTYPGDQQIATEIVNLDDANDRAEFDDNGAASAVFSGMTGNASRNYTGVLLYKYVNGTDAADIPVAWIEFSSAIVKESTSVTVTWNAEGIIQGMNA